MKVIYLLIPTASENLLMTYLIQFHWSNASFLAFSTVFIHEYKSERRWTTRKLSSGHRGKLYVWITGIVTASTKPVQNPTDQCRQGGASFCEVPHLTQELSATVSCWEKKGSSREVNWANHTPHILEYLAAKIGPDERKKKTQSWVRRDGLDLGRVSEGRVKMMKTYCMRVSKTTKNGDSTEQCEFTHLVLDVNIACFISFAYIIWHTYIHVYIIHT